MQIQPAFYQHVNIWYILTNVLTKIGEARVQGVRGGHHIPDVSTVLRCIVFEALSAEI